MPDLRPGNRGVGVSVAVGTQTARGDSCYGKKGNSFAAHFVAASGTATVPATALTLYRVETQQLSNVAGRRLPGWY